MKAKERPIRLEMGVSVLAAREDKYTALIGRKPMDFPGSRRSVQDLRSV
jgi:hypothetical protein